MLRQTYEEKEVRKLLGTVVVELIDDDVVELSQKVLEQRDTVEFAITEVEGIVKNVGVDDKERCLLATIPIQAASILYEIVEGSTSSQITFTKVGHISVVIQLGPPDWYYSVR